MPTIVEVIKSRISANSYDTTRTLSDQEICDLVDLATHAPSAFNLQKKRAKLYLEQQSSSVED